MKPFEWCNFHIKTTVTKWLCPHASEMNECFHRKDVRELGMTLVINARKKNPPLHLYKALLMAQVKTTHLHAHV